MKKLLTVLFPKKAEADRHYVETENEINQVKSEKKQAKRLVIAKNEELQKTVEENHFTIRIYRATGGKLKGV